MRPDPPLPRSPLAQAFITDLLRARGGSVLAGEVISRGESSGFSRHELKNARKRSTSPRIFTYKSPEFSGGWVWTLRNPRTP